MYDLGSQFLVDYEGAKSITPLILQGQTYRFTILTERLIRLEYSLDGTFEDRPTDLVRFRNFPKVEAAIREDEKYLEVTTKYFVLTYLKERPFDSGKLNPTANLRIDVVNDEKTWYYGHAEVRNLKAPFVSFENKTLPKGLYSLDGFATLDDTNGYLINESGILVPKNTNNIDLYLFVYRKDFLAALKDYFMLTGFPEMLPRYALGIWWSKNTNYDLKDIRYLVSKFERNEIPMSVLLLDKDWHIRDTEEQKDLLSGYTFNKQLIPSPSDLAIELHNKHIYLGLEINPIQGIYPHEENYSKIAGFLKVENNQIIPLLPFNHLFIDAYLKALMHPLETLGVDFFWLNYYEKGKLEDLYALTHYQALDANRLDAKRSFVMARNAQKVPHRYGVLYSGITENTFETLASLPYYNSLASNIGVSWLSHDIGGYKNGIENDELYIRYVQFGCFSPIFRFSTDKSKYYKREPWNWNAETSKIVGDYMRLRHYLIPYLYTESYKYHKEGIPLVQPLFYKYPELLDEPLYKNEYYFGSELLIAPITQKGNVLMNRTVHKFFLPNGVWYDFNTGKKFPGGKSYLSFYRKEDYPIFGKAGSIIPLSHHYDVNNTSAPNELEIHIFPGRNNTYVLYEDDGVSNLYKQGYFIRTSIDYNYRESNYTVIIRAVEGKTGITPAKRTYRIRFRNVRKADEVIIYIGDKQGSGESYVQDNDFIVTVRDVPTLSQLTINCKGKDIEIDALRVINEDVESIISDLQIETILKDEINDILFSDLDIKKKRIQIRKLRRKHLEPKFINLFLQLLDYIKETVLVEEEKKGTTKEQSNS